MLPRPTGDKDYRFWRDTGFSIVKSRALPWALLVVLLLYIVVDKLVADVEHTVEGSRTVPGFNVASPHPGASMHKRTFRSVVVSGVHEAAKPALQTAVEDPPRVQHRPTATKSSSRRLAGSSSSSGDGHAEGGHQHDALIFLLSALIIATAITHLTMFPRFHGLQQTVVLFILGVCFSLLMDEEGVGLENKLAVFGRSYKMWMNIDPHLLLFTMLPALLAGDAMNIDTAIARRVAKQCVYLAGPGVVINGFSTGLFLWWYLPHDWSFLLSLVVGAILCATDPVSVVLLLKELGAPPTLTVQIQGESLLNDGTAIVLYTLAYNILRGDTYTVVDICLFLVRTAMCAWGLGLVIGVIFFMWIASAHNKLESHSSMIQISLSLSCAYWSFILAEGVLKMSGVLATVASALVLADKMWPIITSKESMHTVWHVFEYLGNSLIFFLAGALTGRSILFIAWSEYVHLIVIYIVTVLIRFCMLLLSRPILRRFGKEFNQTMTLADTMVLTWSGLRGAVGLSLAIQVRMDRAEGEISEADADRVLFYVAGVAALTLMVNATTCPFIVRWLGVATLPETKQRILLMIHDELFHLLDQQVQAQQQEFKEGQLVQLEEVMDKMEDRILVGVAEAQDPNSAPARNSIARMSLAVMEADGIRGLTQKAASKASQIFAGARASGRSSVRASERRSLDDNSQAQPVRDWRRSITHEGVLTHNPNSLVGRLSNNMHRMSNLSAALSFRSGHSAIVGSCASSPKSGAGPVDGFAMASPSDSSVAARGSVGGSAMHPVDSTGRNSLEAKSALSVSSVLQSEGVRTSAVSRSSGDGVQSIEFSERDSTDINDLRANMSEPIEKGSENKFRNAMKRQRSVHRLARMNSAPMRERRHLRSRTSAAVERRERPRLTRMASDVSRTSIASQQAKADNDTPPESAKSQPYNPRFSMVAESEEEKRRATLKKSGTVSASLEESFGRKSSKRSNGIASTSIASTSLRKTLEDAPITKGESGRETLPEQTFSWALLTAAPPVTARYSSDNPEDFNPGDELDAIKRESTRRSHGVGHSRSGSSRAQSTRSSKGFHDLVSKMKRSWSKDDSNMETPCKDMHRTSTPVRRSAASVKSGHSSKSFIPFSHRFSSARLSVPGARGSMRSRASLKSGISAVSGAILSTSMSAMTSSLMHLRQSIMVDVSSATKLLNEVKQLKIKVARISDKHLKLLGDLPELENFKEDDIFVDDHMMVEDVEPKLLWATNEAMLNLVYAKYWGLIEKGDVVHGTNEAEIILTSVKLALSNCRGNLADFRFLRVFMQMPSAEAFGPVQNIFERASSLNGVMSQSEQAQLESIVPGLADHVEDQDHLAKGVRCVKRFVDSAYFNGFVMLAIMVNVVCIAVEDATTDEKEQAHIIWLMMDVAFTVIFLVEFLLKFVALRMRYFQIPWNVYDFVLVIIGVISVCINAYAQDSLEDGKSNASEQHLLSMARIFRVLRVVRVIRLLKFWQVLKARMKNKELSIHIAERIQRLSILVAFIKAHAASQKDIIRYFGKETLTEVVEIGHTLLQSQIAVYKSLLLAVCEQRELEAGMLREVNEMQMRKKVAEDLQSFVSRAHHGNIITAREADSMIRPLKEQIKTCTNRIRESHFGYVQKTSAASSAWDSEQDRDVPSIVLDAEDHIRHVKKSKLSAIDSRPISESLPDCEAMALSRQISSDSHVSKPRSEVVPFVGQNRLDAPTDSRAASKPSVSSEAVVRSSPSPNYPSDDGLPCAG